MRDTLKWGLLFVVTFGFVFVFWMWIGFLPSKNSVPGIDLSSDLTIPGQFGDSFGWINSLFTALAFAGVLLTLLMQRQELQLQREEMKLTREELISTREEHSRSAQAQEKSENRLFLAAYMNALESLRQFSQWRMSGGMALIRTGG